MSFGAFMVDLLKIALGGAVATFFSWRLALAADHRRAVSERIAMMQRCVEEFSRAAQERWAIHGEALIQERRDARRTDEALLRARVKIAFGSDEFAREVAAILFALDHAHWEGMPSKDVKNELRGFIGTATEAMIASLSNVQTRIPVTSLPTMPSVGCTSAVTLAAKYLPQRID